MNLTLETIEKTLQAQLRDLEYQWEQAKRWENDRLRIQLECMGDAVRTSLSLLRAEVA